MRMRSSTEGRSFALIANPQTRAHGSAMTEKDQRKRLGARIVEARDAAKISQVDLAKRLDVSVSTVLRWEKGAMGPRPEYLSQIADLTGVSVDWLLGGASGGPGSERRQEAPPPTTHLELDDDPAVHDPLLAKFLAEFSGDFSADVLATMRTGVFGADGQRPSSLMGYVKLAQQLEKALAGEVRIVFEPVKK